MKRNELFSDAELCMAASRLNEAMLGALPSPKECEHTFSAAFLAKMERLLKTDLRMRRSKTWRRRVAAILLAFLIGSGVFLAVNTEARAAVVRWITEVWEQSIVYRFFGKSEESSLPNYNLGWVPEEYELASDYSDDQYREILYCSRDTDAILLFTYSKMQEGSIHELLFPEGTILPEIVNLNGQTLYYFPVDESSGLANLIWLDETKQLFFEIDGELEKDVILHIFTEIKLAN